MSANTSPIFVLTVKRPQVRISTANTSRSGSGTIGTVYTAGAAGSLFRRFRIQPEAVVPAGDVVRLFNQVAGSGNHELIAEVYIPPISPAASGAGAPPIPVLPSFIWPDPTRLSEQGVNVNLGAGDVVGASTDQGNTYSVALEEGGDY